MVIERKCDIFKGRWDVMAHQVNEYGVMGAGVAKAVKQRYPEVYRAYRVYCLDTQDTAGTVLPIVTDDRKIVCNCFSQTGWTTQYDLVDTVAKKLLNLMKKWNLESLAIPKYYGCGLGKGDWGTVLKIFEKYFLDEPNITLKIYKL